VPARIRTRIRPTLVAGLAAVAALAAPAGALAEAPEGAAVADDPSRPLLVAGPAAFLGEPTRVTGRVTGGGGPVLVQRLAPGGAWVAIGTGQAGADGSFAIDWRPDHIGRFVLRASASGAIASAADEGPTTVLTVHRAARATWYGPGFYGKHTACGLRFTRALAGVAHRWLPCGTPVSVSYHGRTIVVPVVDRGPFAAGVSWDLTAAAARTLGFTVTDRLGAVALRGARVVAR